MSHHEPGELLSHNTDPAIDTDALGELGDLAYEDLEDAFDDFDDDSYEDNSLSELSVVDYLDNQDEAGSQHESDGEDAFNEDMAYFHQHLRAAHGFRKAKGRGGGGRRVVEETAYSHEVRTLISQANQKYVQNQLQDAQNLVEQIIRIDGSVFPAWKMLGEIHKERGNEKKCFMSWFTAAHCKPKDYNLWDECARMSIELEGPNETAIYCYNRALRANPNDISIIYDKAALHRQLGQLNKAAEGFLGLMKALPNDMSVLKEIAQVFIKLKRVPDAIEYYEESVKFYQSSDVASQDGFGWSDLNILAELYMLENRWDKSISMTKSLGRWLWGRLDEAYWDQIQGDDREWDEYDESRKIILREYTPGKYQEGAYVMPIELRVKLGVCRLKLGHLEEATLHFRHLDKQDPNVYFDLFQEAGDALTDFGSFDLALEYYGTVAASDSAGDPKLWFSMARCYKEIGNIEDAEACYHNILSMHPGDIDARMQLAEIYEVSDRREEALELVNEIIALRRQQEAPGATNNGQEFGEADTFFKAPQLRGESRRQRRTGTSAAERVEMLNRKREQTLTKFRKIDYLRPRMDAGDMNSVREWLDTAGELVDDFRNTRAFFPSERSHQFKGFATTAMRRAAKRGTDANMERIQHRLQEALTTQEEDIASTEVEDLTQFHGIGFDEWLYIFMQYALCLTKYEDPQDAYDVIKVAKEANVFFHNERRRFIVHCIHLACALEAQDADVASEVTRFFTHSHQFQGEAYRLFSAVMLLCKNGENVFHHGANQKYYLRQIKAMDKVLTGRTNIVGAASLTGKAEDGGAYVPKEFDVNLLMLYGHMVAAGRSYIPALNYFARAYSLAPDHPMVNLSIGIAYLHRAMQRQSDNRHWDILQAMTFLFEYHDIRNSDHEHWRERQEAEYNIARAFHQIGLSHLAIQYYERALAISDEHLSKAPLAGISDFRQEAAYNLQTIYMSSGNSPIAREITEKYLVI